MDFHSYWLVVSEADRFCMQGPREGLQAGFQR